MEHFEDIVSAFSRIDAPLDEEIRRARRDGGPWQQLEERQQTTARAYFLLLWAQFETALDRSCQSAIDLGRRDGWQHGRAWDVLARIGLDRLPLLERVALVFDRNSHHYRDIRTKYRVRNELAHGAWPGIPIDLYREADSFRRLSDRLAG